MKSIKCKCSMFLILLMTMLGHGNAQMFKSNVDGLVIKDTKCQEPPFPNLFGTIVNRMATESRGIVNVKIYDSDSDIVYQRDVTYFVGPQTGTNINFQIDVGRCSAPYKYLVTITECKVGDVLDDRKFYGKCMDK